MKKSNTGTKGKNGRTGIWAALSTTTHSFEQAMSWKRVFWVLAALSLITFVSGSFQAGISGDEDVQVPYGEKALDFYASWGEDTSVFKSKKGDAIRYYGGGFEVPVTLISKAFGIDIESRSYFHLRHLLLALLGWLSVLCAGGIARMLGGWRTAVIALVLLWLSPRFFGHAMMNPKDIPFAAGYIGSIFFMFRIFKNLPKFSRWDVVGLLVALGYSLSVRVGAVLIFIYFIAFFIAFILAKNWASSGKEYSVAQVWPAFVAPIVGGFVLGVLFWPYGLLSPIAHTVESLTTFTEFPVSINVLFRGDMVWSSDIPFEYLFVWIGSTVPITFLLGVLLFLISGVYLFKKGPTFLLLCNIFVVLFPLFYVVYKDSPLYDGWRHFNFIYVAAVPLIALAWDVFGQWINRRWKGQYLAYSLFFLLSLEPAYHIATNLSIPYVYFNPIVGGTSGAFGEFEMDYWGTSTRKAVEAMEDRGILHEDMEEKIVIGVNFSYGVRHWLKPKYAEHVKLKYTRYRERYNSDWDYAIFVGRFMDGAHMKAIDWPGSVRVLESITVNDEPVCAIFRRGEEFAFEGISAFRAGNTELAKELLKKEISYDPKNELAYFTLGELYLQEGQNKAAISYFEESLRLNPHDQQLIQRLSTTYLNDGQVDKAERLLKENVQRNPKDYASYYYLALIHAQTQRLNTAAEYIEQSIDANPNFREAYGLGAQIYEALGNESKASYYETLSKQ